VASWATAAAHVEAPAQPRRAAHPSAVALNVAVLQLNVRLDKLGRERAQLRADNAALASELSSAAAAPRIQTLAQNRLGLVFAPPDQTTYVELGK
jgi:cell division protein FtsL